MVGELTDMGLRDAVVLEASGNIVFDDLGKSHAVNRNSMLTGIILHDTGEESLREEESGDPVVVRSAQIDPFINEIETVLEFDCPSREGLQGVEAFSGPDARYLTIK